MTSNGDARDLLIETDGLCLAYASRTVLEDVNLHVQRGECWFFVGPNGSGKTTLLRAVLGALPAQAGRVRIHLGPERIGFVPQRCEFNPALPTTVREFVLLGLVGIRVPRSEHGQRLGWALEQVGLQGLEKHDYWSLSGGQRQRALVARALIRRPTLLLADEPTNGLDLLTQQMLLNSLADLRRTEQLTLVFIAHDLALAARYGSHVALFHDGHVQAGTAAHVLRPETLHRVYQLPLEYCEGLAATATAPGELALRPV